MSCELKYKYNGVIHVHSSYSDGTGDIKTIARAAKQAGLDWIIITDHNNFDIQEGIIEGVTVIKGEEISPENNHYLALGINRCIMPSNDIKITIKTVQEQGGFGFAAHPDELETRKNSFKPIRWLDKNIEPDGIEIWNWFSRWADYTNDKNIFTLAYSFLFRNNQVKKPYRITLDWWDKLNSKNDKIIPAIVGVDAHALKVRKYLIPVYVFPYKSMFKTLINEIILDKPFDNDFFVRKNQILNALKNGQNMMFNRTRIDKAPEFYIKNESSTAFCGEHIELDNNTYLYFNCNKCLNVNVYNNSGYKTFYKEKNIKMKIYNSGKYRIECEIQGYGAAYSNCITVSIPASEKNINERQF